MFFDMDSLNAFAKRREERKLNWKDKYHIQDEY